MLPDEGVTSFWDEDAGTWRVLENFIINKEGV